MKSMSSQTPGGVNSNACPMPSPAPAQKESSAANNQNNAAAQGGRNTFASPSLPCNSPADGGKTYTCQCTVSNANNAQDGPQFQRREDHPFHGGTGADNLATGGWQGWRYENAGNGRGLDAGGLDAGGLDAGGLDAGGLDAGGLRVDAYQLQSNTSWQNNNNNVLPLTACCLVVSDGQQTDDQGRRDTAAVKVQHDGTQTICDSTTGKLGLQSQGERDHFASRRHHAICRLNQVPATVPEAPIPQPKVMHVAPPFQGITVNKGEFQDVKLSDYRGRYLCFFFYPLDFTFVCPTEIRAMSDLHDQFKEVNCAILGCSCDSHFTHLAYIKTPKQNNGLGEIKFPLLSDYTKKISSDYNVLTEDGAPLRALFIIDPVGIIRNITINDAGVGRNTDEVLRMVQAIKRVDDFDELCPHGWEPGGTTFEPTRPGALNYYRQLNSQKSEQKNEEQDQPDACSYHIEYHNEKMYIL